VLHRALCGVLILICSALAHEGIDLAGNVLLQHDAYDGMPHEARLTLAIAGIAALACCVIGYVLRVADMRGGFDLAGAAREFRERRKRTAFALTAGTLSLVPLLEWFDVSCAGAHIEDIGDAYGGSVLLGGAVCIALALLLSLAVFAAARWLCAHEWRICRFIARVLRACAPPSLRRSLLLAAECVAHSYEKPLAGKHAMRAPPAVLA
jgi:hypothetical protein